jgi:pimeloyl-ACP methyl ester carboxylesterase
MAVAEVRGARIAYDDTGGKQPAVILAHGFLMDRDMFRPQVQALRSTHRVVTWDERGFGETEYDELPFTYWDSADDCLSLLDHLGIERAVVGGMSQGGFVALRVALTAPERVRGLVLLDTQAGTEDEEVIPLYQAMLDDWCEHGLSDELGATIAGIILGDPAVDASYIAKWQARPRTYVRTPGQTLLTRESIVDRLGEITAPALVVHGTADAAVSADRAQRLADGLAGCEGVVWVEGATHAANLTHADEVNAALTRFLATLPD